jgi:hypothetical protein
MALVPEIIKASVDPAAGGEIVYTADEDMTIHSVSFTFATSAVVANRQVGLIADDGNPANIFFRSIASGTHPASQTSGYCAFEGAVPGVGGGLYAFSLPALGLKLRKGDRIRTNTVGLDPGDNLTAMMIQAEREY